MKNTTLRLALIMALLVFTITGCEADPVDENNKVELSPAEKELYNLIMKYRAGLNLPNIPLSASLSYVAREHVIDLDENNPVTTTCNMHSWSDKGSWSACCYTDDHLQASCMWDKPRELTEYTGDGFEIAYFHSSGATPTAAINGWKSSPGHNQVMINAGPWSQKWKAIGIGIKGRYAVVWFGHEEDLVGTPSAQPDF
jgi:uncharacterized protein YkwD